MQQFINHTIQHAIWQPIEQWLLDHPMVNWFLLHPLLLVSIVIVFILLLVGLMGAIARATENLWIQALKLPFRLVWASINSTILLLRPIVTRWRNVPSQGISTNTAFAELSQQSDITPSPQQELEYLLNRLDEIRQEEAELMQQIKAIIQHR